MGLFAPEASGTWERLTTMCRPATERINTRRPVRRVAAIAATVGYGVLLWAFRADLGLPRGLDVATMIALVALWAWGLTVVFEFRRRLANAPDGALDERERIVRDRAYLQSHRITSLVLAASGIASVAVLDAGTGIAAQDVTNGLMTLMMAVVVLPAAVIAWQEPDDADLDAETDDGTAPSGDDATDGRVLTGRR